MRSFPNVVRNLKKIIGGRQVWSAESEFAYYAVTPEELRNMARRQEAFARSGYFVGSQIARAMRLVGEDSVLGKDVLDLGAGESLLAGALRFAHRARTVWALDAVPRQIWAAARHNEGDADYRFVIASASALPFDDASFDVVTANLVMHHIEPIAPVLAEVARVLRPGGVFTCIEPAPFVGALVHERGSDNEAPIPPARVERELRAAGFDDVDVTWSWTRFNTSLLGPLSPGYAVKGRLPRIVQRHATDRPRPRALEPSGLRNLAVDPTCPHLGHVRTQCHEISSVLARLS